jgi:hypothetical protein
MEIFIFTVILLALCVAGLCVRIFIKGEFTENEIGSNKNMKKLGIKCVKNEETEQRRKNKSGNDCSACSFFGSCDKI